MPATDPRVLILDLVDDPASIAAYEEWHRPGGPPAAVTRSIRAAGVERLDIYRAGNRLVMLMHVLSDREPDAQAASDAVDPEVRAWETLMDTLQQRLSFAPDGVKWVAAERIYSLHEQP